MRIWANDFGNNLTVEHGILGEVGAVLLAPVALCKEHADRAHDRRRATAPRKRCLFDPAAIAWHPCYAIGVIRSFADSGTEDGPSDVEIVDYH